MRGVIALLVAHLCREPGDTRPPADGSQGTTTTPYGLAPAPYRTDGLSLPAHRQYAVPSAS